MAECVLCVKEGVEYQYSEGGYVCDNCVGSCFTCPDCGLTFPLETDDAGNGFCSK
ncbi:hypothetical protein [Clostridium drakei]|uniref:hypothetical protein n=1 Tax=Clostridium drakei TaxID=332101 RepID=UPI000A63FCF9|nr:hypothetical protein [Clostridium drakei]